MKKCFTSILLILIFSFGYSNALAAKQSLKVLVLNSYHYGYEWSDNIISGIQTALNQSDFDIELYLEYMDTKRHYDDVYYQQLHDIYKHKYGKVKFDVIISGDDNAFNFIIKHRDELFPGIPVVFCGVNNFEDSRIAGRKKITGIVENPDIKDTLDIALRLHPSAQHIAVVFDQTSSGLANYERFKAISSLYRKRVEFKAITGVAFSELRQSLHLLPEKTIVLYLHFLVDRNGTVLSMKKVLDMISRSSKKPVYSCWAQEVGRGVMGGKVVSGIAQGKAAAETALRILHGEAAENIPVLSESPNVFMFDYKQIDRWGIDIAALPEGSILINRPFSFYDEYKYLIWSVISAVMLLLVIVASLAGNIMRRKKVEGALQESEQKYRTVLEANPDPVVVYDVEGKVVYFNPAFTRIFGWSLEERIGKKMDVFVPEKSWPETEMMIKKVLSGESFSGIESHRYTKEGNLIPVSLSGSIYRDQAGNRVGSVVNLRDIGKQKKLEAQLQQAQKMEAIGTLAGGIAHDFNNILAVIIGYTEMSLEDALKETQLYANLSEALIAGKRARDLVKQILTFSRQGDRKIQPVQIGSIIKEALKFLRSSLPATIEIRRNIETDSLVQGDPTQIHQILMNLCTNAGHAMHEKGGTLEVELVNVELDADFATKHPNMHPGSYVQLTVSDTGHGMPPDVLDRIFDPFFTTKALGEGTGMGLSVVHGIVKSHGGTILVYSEPGKGSAFKVFIPAIEMRKEPAAGVKEPIPTGMERILLVDDEPTLLHMIKQSLESLGYDVATRASSIEALELFKARPDRFDLVITDMTMPQMRGDRLAVELKRIRPNTPVILCTGFSMHIDQQKAAAMGIRALVSKPMLKRDIAKTIRKVLDS